MEQKSKPKNSVGPINSEATAQPVEQLKETTIYLLHYPIHAIFLSDSYDFLKPSVYCRYKKEKKQKPSS